MSFEVGVNPAAAIARGNHIVEGAGDYRRLTTDAQNACRSGQAAAGERAVAAGYGALGEALVSAVLRLGAQAHTTGTAVATGAGLAAQADRANTGGFLGAAGALPTLPGRVPQ